jgi:glycosyltransferase involved in cell wall biosynthesis
MPISFNEVSEKSSGGTELMSRKLLTVLDEKEHEHVQIIPSRVRELDEDKVRIFWCHDLPNDPESMNVLKDEGWRKFERLVFVSYWQRQAYVNAFSIPYDKTIVLQNAIDPIEDELIAKKPDPKEKIKIIYHTTPHRGLDIAYHAVEALCKKHPEIEFDVFSSFKIYGWDQRDEHFQELFDAIEAHPNMNYHGTVTNETVRKHVAESHIFGYPSCWPETSCISLMEAMSSKCICVHPDLAALPETAANWTYMYNWTEDKASHADRFASCMHMTINALKAGDKALLSRVSGQKSYADIFYSWELRTIQWKQFLESLKDVEPRPVEEKLDFQEEEFVYKTA